MRDDTPLGANNISDAAIADLGPLHNVPHWLEIEFDDRLFSGREYFNRLDPYLVALSRAPDLRRKSVVIYEGGGTLIQLSSSPDSLYRALYSRLVASLVAP